jgi:hypothetical protein
MIRDCGLRDFDAMLDIVNQAAEAYRAFVPAEEWKDPSLSRPVSSSCLMTHAGTLSRSG